MAGSDVLIAANYTDDRTSERALFRRRDLLAGPGTQVSLGRFHALVPELLLRFAHVRRVGLVGARLGP